ncbi:hypothetical protein B0I35DRAFT_411725 [Stachybotrys elegans]|uniref:Uncharacterized protein n=1 Tax=Stachybotrys elegans TaxID=80388 RepID=A0A8K0SM70_9HYPO|nr:hypothetical protein B0I35DRAFT_411725 [Stachybotrys elegans]
MASPSPPPYPGAPGYRDSTLPETAPADLPEAVPISNLEVPVSRLPEVVAARHDSPPETAYSSLPEAVPYSDPHHHHHHQDKTPWWRRHWLWPVIAAILVAGGAIGGGIGGALASRRESDGPSDPGVVGTTEPPPTSTIPSQLVNSVGFLESDESAACDEMVAYAAPGRTPCDQPFELSDGLTYRWRGCSQLPRFMTWAEGIDGEETRLGLCASIDPGTQWTCRNSSIIEAQWLCGPDQQP